MAVCHNCKCPQAARQGWMEAGGLWFKGKFQSSFHVELLGEKVPSDIALLLSSSGITLKVKSLKCIQGTLPHRSLIICSMVRRTADRWRVLVWEDTTSWCIRGFFYHESINCLISNHLQPGHNPPQRFCQWFETVPWLFLDNWFLKNWWFLK